METDINNYTFVADGSIVCNFKDSLRRSEPIGCNGIDGSNYEEMFALYADGHDRAKLNDIKEFLRYNPQLKEQFESWREVELIPDNSISFDNKEQLKHRVFNLSAFYKSTMYKVSAAASIVIVIGAMWSIISHETQVNEAVTNSLIANHYLEQDTPDQSHEPIVITTEETVDVPVEVLNATSPQEEITSKTAPLIQSSNNAGFIAQIEPKELQLNDMVDDELIAIQMMADAKTSIHSPTFIIDDATLSTSRRPRNFVGKIFEGVAQIFKSTDKEAIRHIALTAIGGEVDTNNTQKQVTSVDNSKNETGFYIMGIYIVKKKAE